MRIKLSLAVLALPAAAFAQLKIVTTAPDFADIARKIGGDKVVVHSVMKGPENVHNVRASPTEMIQLNGADLFVHSGLDAEPWRDNLVKGARNPKILPNQPGAVDMSEGIPLKEVPQGRVDRSMGDVHAYGNPHYTLNPQNAQRMAVTLVKALVQVDPSNTEFYKANAKKFVVEMGELATELKTKFAPYSGLKVITFHRAWEYFAEAINLNITDTIEQKIMITPSPAEVKGVIDRAKAEGVKVVICETYDDSNLAQYVADQIGAKMVVLPDHVNGIPGVETYQKLFRYDVDQLIDAARAGGVEPHAVTAADTQPTLPTGVTVPPVPNAGASGGGR